MPKVTVPRKLPVLCYPAKTNLSAVPITSSSGTAVFYGYSTSASKSSVSQRPKERGSGFNGEFPSQKCTVLERDPTTKAAYATRPPLRFLPFLLFYSREDNYTCPISETQHCSGASTRDPQFKANRRCTGTRRAFAKRRLLTYTSSSA